jgi:hypothetical protein
VPGTLYAIRAEAAVVLAQAKLGRDVVGEAKKAAEAAKQAAEQAAKVKSLVDLVPVYLAIGERGGRLEEAAGQDTRRSDALPHEDMGPAARRAHRQDHAQVGQGPARRERAPKSPRIFRPHFATRPGNFRLAIQQ